MANFDSNQWYHLYVNENKNQALVGASLSAQSNGTRGSAFFQAANLTQPNQRWQFYAVNSTFYVLRTSKGGPDAFLSTKFEEDESTPGQTQPQMIRGNVSDDSVYWRVSPWGDGTFFLTNKENGTAWHLERKPNALLAMDSNITQPQDGQRWLFDTIATINNERFSTVNLPTATVNSPATITADPSEASSSSSDSGSGSGGLSTGAQAAIGASIGGAAVIALVVLGLFLWRRRRRRQSSVPASKMPAEAPDKVVYGRDTGTLDTHHDGAVSELPTTQYAELPQHERPVELPGDGYSPR